MYSSYRARTHHYDSGGPEFDEFQPTYEHRPISFSEFVRNRDAFGHSISLNVDKKGSTHKTMCGGIVTIWMYILIIAYVSLHFIVAGRGDVKLLGQSDQSQPLGDGQKVLLKDQNFMLFLQIQDTSSPKDLNPLNSAAKNL